MSAHVRRPAPSFVEGSRTRPAPVVRRGLETLVLVVPSLAAAVELPRRLATATGALTGIYPLRVMDLARALAEPALLGQGLRDWDLGHDALLTSRLLDEGHGLPVDGRLPRPPLAAALARTLSSLRAAGVPPDRLEALAETSPAMDRDRLRGLASLYRRFAEAVEGRVADPSALLREASRQASSASWLRDAEVLLVEGLELDVAEQDFLQAIARVVPVRLADEAAHTTPLPGSCAAWAVARGVPVLPWSDTPLAPLVPSQVPAGLERLRARLFAPAEGASVLDSSVELVTAAGEAEEARAVARRLLREAIRGVPFEEMGVLLPRPGEYAPIFSDLLGRVGIPFRLHPSLPLRTGRAARSLLLLLRCRGLRRLDVMELLTFARVPGGFVLGEDARPRVGQWEEVSRNAGVTEGLPRWREGLEAYAAAKRREAESEKDGERRRRGLERVGDVLSLLRVVVALSETLRELEGPASWHEWSVRLRRALDLWVGEERDREAVAAVLADLATLGWASERASRAEVEDVLLARLEWERAPLVPPAQGGVHVGALDALAGIPFRVVAIPGLVEGGYPGPVRQDPFLLDPEREALAAPAAAPARPERRQLSLFDEARAPGTWKVGPLPTSQDRLVEARRHFHRALAQATERIILSYPRADPRTGRERLPSLFFVQAASALEGRPLDMSALGPLLVEDEPRRLDTALAVDASERDRSRVLVGGHEASSAIAAGWPVFGASLRAAAARRSSRLTRYDGLVDLGDGLPAGLDPTISGRPLSATRIRTYADCGFQYLLRHVLRLEAVLEPEDRMGLDPLERGSVFHEVAERFLRERRQRGELPVRDSEVLRRRLVELGEEALARLVVASPPRHRLLWDMVRARFHELLIGWLAREASSVRGTPAHFEVGFGVPRPPEGEDLHSAEPLAIDLGDGRVLRVSGKIDRIDTKPDGSLIVRDYKTGRAPKDDGGLFRGGRQLQIPFYVRATATLIPGRSVSEAFLDYVDGGRLVGFDPSRATGEEFLVLLRGLVDSMGQGLFVQDPAACRFCDFTRVCGPEPLIAARLARKRRDPRVQRVLRIKESP